MEEIHSPNDIFSLSVKIIAYISLLLLPLGAIAGPKSPTCSTSECHANIKNFTFLHGPVKANGCTVCHQLGEGHLNLPAKHPQLLAIPKGNSTCLVCHDDKSGAGFKTIHKPLQEQGCTTCHNPHGSNFPKLQKQKSVADLCLSCHKEMKTQAHAGHGPVLMENTSCLTCHGPHFSHEKKLLKAPENKLCFQCHNKEITVAGHVVSNIEKKTKEEFKHPPVAEGKCDSCHAVHGSAEKSFLKKPFATTDFSLCLECHKKDLAGASFTDSQTGFRNGNQNLHFFHLHRPGTGRAITCASCHEVHGSSQAALIHPFMDFGEWKVPIAFTKTPSGGTCLAACHKEKKYDREHAFTNSPGR